MFHCRLEMPSPRYADSGSTPVWENVGHTYDCLVMEGCRQLEDTDCRFVIGGFGQRCWRFDVGYDMSSLVEQLPELLSSVAGGAAVTVDLYPQGIERALTFVPRDGDQVEIVCVSRTPWVPDPARETVGRAELMEMLRRLAVDFARALDLVVPDIARLEPFSSWRSGVVVPC